MAAFAAVPEHIALQDTPIERFGRVDDLEFACICGRGSDLYTLVEPAAMQRSPQKWGSALGRLSS